MNAAAAASEPYQFLVGPQRRKFTIHSAIVARQSPYLDKLVNGDFKEGSEKLVQWEDVDEETFVCFWQYAYTGDYDIPREEPKTTEVAMEEEVEGGKEMGSPEHATENGDEVVERRVFEIWESEEVREEDAFSLVEGAGLKKTKKKNRSAEKRRENSSKRAQLWEVFTALRLTRGDENEPSLPQEKTGDLFDASNLLCHTRVYVFADCYGIFDLMKLSYDRIHQALCNLDLRTETLADIIALVHYCYETPAPPDLKELVVLYSACNIEKLWVDEQFQHIVETHGDLSRAIVGSMLSRLN